MCRGTRRPAVQDPTERGASAADRDSGPAPSALARPPPDATLREPTMTTTPPTHAPFDSGVPASARDFSVEGRVVVVTGAAQGIGRELARQFAAAGAVSVVADLDIKKAESVVKEIHDAGGTGLAVKVNVADEPSVTAMVDTVIETWGRIDVLINNASVFATLDKVPF